MTSRSTFVPDQLGEHLAPYVQEALLKQGYDVRLPNLFRPVIRPNFQGPTPPGLRTLMLCQPSSEHNFAQIDPADPATARDLNKIRDEHEVYIEFPKECEGFIRISTNDISRLRSSSAAIRDLIYMNGQELSAKTFPLIHRDGSDTRVLLKTTQNYTVDGIELPGGWRATAKPAADDTVEHAAPSTSGLTVLADTGQKDDADAVSTTRFLETLFRASQAIRPCAGDPRMRIHFGELSITEKKKNSPNEYNALGFKTILAEAATRGSTYFGNNLGVSKLTDKILKNICSTWDELDPIYIPEDPLVDKLEDVRRQYCMMFFSGSYRIEIDVQYAPNNRSIVPTAAYPRVFQSYDKALQTEVVVACPDKKFDWRLSVESDIGPKEIPAAFIKLQRAIKFEQVPEEGSEFPRASVPMTVLTEAKIDSAACKVYSLFSCAILPFNIEVGVYHDWRRTPKHAPDPRKPNIYFSTLGCGSPLPVKSCTLSFYGMAWDEALRELNVTSQGFPRKFVDIFSVYGCGLEDSITGLLKEVNRLLDIVSTEAGGLEKS